MESSHEEAEGGRQTDIRRAPKNELGSQMSDRERTVRWEELKLTGQMYSPRYDHTMARRRNKLYLFGGNTGKMYATKTQFLNDLFEYDLERKSSCYSLQMYHVYQFRSGGWFRLRVPVPLLELDIQWCLTENVCIYLGEWGVEDNSWTIFGVLIRVWMYGGNVHFGGTEFHQPGLIILRFCMRIVW